MLDTAQDFQALRHQAHAYLDCLTPEQVNAIRALLETMVSALDRKLAQAPVDDEPVTAEDRAAIQAGLASLDQNGGVSMDDVLADFGLTREGFDKLTDTPNESNG
jgi:hypothetical protein